MNLSFNLIYHIGSKGYYIGLLAPGLLVVGAVSVYFVILTQVTYPLFLAIWSWITATDYDQYNDPTPKHFSPFYTALVYFIVAIFITNKKDLKLFVKLGSFGSFFVMSLMVFVIGVGIIAFGNTSFTTGTEEESNMTNWLSD